MHVPQEDIISIEPNIDSEAKNIMVNGVSQRNKQANGIVDHQNQQQQKRPTRNMNMHGVFLHVLADALGSVIVIISALIVQYTDWKYNVYVDPALSVIMVIIISHSTIPLCKYRVYCFSVKIVNFVFFGFIFF